VNLFPTDEPGDRIRPQVGAPALLEALLDAEPARAMGQAQVLLAQGQGDGVLRVLAEAATRNDPVFNHAHQVLAVAAAADLMPHLPHFAQEAMLGALAKSLANSQGSEDLGCLAAKALGQ
jgi:hypothetical protein